jgi:divalent metal cation (Fe/Co/Zn/Cd) transporter
MPARDSRKIIFIAIIANLAIAGLKLFAATVTKSSAMLAEAIHSAADTGNELLLLLGMRRSARPADALHPFGHGKALYFYSLLVAVYIFAFGGGLSIYEGDVAATAYYIAGTCHVELPRFGRCGRI